MIRIKKTKADPRCTLGLCNSCGASHYDTDLWCIECEEDDFGVRHRITLCIDCLEVLRDKLFGLEK